MSLPRVSVGQLMILVAVISLHLAAARYLDGWSMAAPGDVGGILSMGGTLMIMLSVMALRLARSGESGSFLFGFEAFGWAAVLVCLAFLVFSSGWLTTYFVAAIWPLWHVIGPSGTLLPDPVSGEKWVYPDDPPSYSYTLYHLSGVLFITVPQLLFASLGGWLFRRLGIEVVVQAGSRAGRGFNTRVHEAGHPADVEPDGEQARVP